MQIRHSGVFFDYYQSASPGRRYSTFTDVDGAKLTIKTETLIRMYELVKFDLGRSGVFDKILSDMRKDEELQLKEYGQ